MDVLTVEIEPVRAVFAHDPPDFVQEQPHILPRWRTGRPSLEPLKRVYRPRLQRRALQKIIRLVYTIKRIPLRCIVLRSTRKLLHPQPRNELQIPVFPQHHFRLKQHDIALIAPRIQCFIRRIARFARPMPYHVILQRAFPVIRFRRDTRPPTTRHPLEGYSAPRVRPRASKWSSIFSSEQ